MKKFRALVLIGFSILGLFGIAATPASAMRDPFVDCVRGPCLPPIVVCVREPCP